MDALTPRPLSREQFMMLTMGLTTLDQITQKRLDRELRYLQGKLQCAYERQYATLSDRALFVEFRQSHGWLNEDYGVVTDEAKARWWAIRKVLAGRPHIERVSVRRENRNELARVNRGQSKSKNR